MSSAPKINPDRERELADLRAMMKLPAGRRVLFRIFAHGRPFATTFSGNSTSFFNEGMRNSSLWLMNELLEADRDRFLEAWKENLDRQVEAATQGDGGAQDG